MEKSKRSPIWGAPSATLKEVDWAILHELARDPLASSRSVAEAIGISLSQAQSRIRALDRRRISHVVAVLDTRVSGQSLAWVTVGVRGRSVEEVATELANIREVMMVSTLGSGAHDILLCVRFRNVEDLHSHLLVKVSGIVGIARQNISVVLNTPVFRPEYVTISREFLNTDVAAIAKDLEVDFGDGVLDELDRNIVAELQVNGRTSAKAIADRYGISPGAVRYRIRALQNNGIMRFMTLFLPQELGINSFAFLEVSVVPSAIDRVIEELRKKPWLPQLFICTGQATIKGVLFSESIEQITRIRTEEIGQLDGVLQVEISPLLKAYKFETRWGQPFSKPLVADPVGTISL